MEELNNTTFEGIHTPFDDDLNEDVSYGIPKDFDQNLATLFGDDLAKFLAPFDVEQLDYIAKSRYNYLDVTILYSLLRIILKRIDEDLYEALDNMENCIEANIDAGISAWGRSYDYLYKKQREYQAMIKEIDDLYPPSYKPDEADETDY